MERMERTVKTSAMIVLMGNAISPLENVSAIQALMGPSEYKYLSVQLGEYSALVGSLKAVAR